MVGIKILQAGEKKDFVTIWWSDFNLFSLILPVCISGPTAAVYMNAKCCILLYFQFTKTYV